MAMAYMLVPSAICHLLSAICHLPFAIGHMLFPVKPIDKPATIDLGQRMCVDVFRRASLRVPFVGFCQVVEDGLHRAFHGVRFCRHFCGIDPGFLKSLTIVCSHKLAEDPNRVFLSRLEEVNASYDCA